MAAADMSEEKLWDTVTAVFRETFDRPDLTPSRETTAGDVAEWDSVTHIQLLVGLEEAFGVTFSTGDIAGLENVGQLVDLIAARVGARE